MNFANHFLPLAYLQIFGNLAQGAQCRQTFAANSRCVLVVDATAKGQVVGRGKRPGFVAPYECKVLDVIVLVVSEDIESHQSEGFGDLRNVPCDERHGFQKR